MNVATAYSLVVASRRRPVVYFLSPVTVPLDIVVKMETLIINTTDVNSTQCNHYRQNRPLQPLNERTLLYHDSGFGAPDSGIWGF